MCAYIELTLILEKYKYSIQTIIVFFHRLTRIRRQVKIM